MKTPKGPFEINWPLTPQAYNTEDKSPLSNNKRPRSDLTLEISHFDWLFYASNIERIL